MSDLAEMLASAKEAGYREGRADAIEEFVKEFCTHDEDYEYPCICPITIYEFAEQIKEQKNE